MLTLPLIAALTQISASEKTKIISFGDVQQVPAVFNSWRGKSLEGNVFEHSQLLKRWSNSTMFELTQCRRSDENHFKFYCSLSENLEQAKEAVKGH